MHGPSCPAVPSPGGPRSLGVLAGAWDPGKIYFDCVVFRERVHTFSLGAPRVSRPKKPLSSLCCGIHPDAAQGGPEWDKEKPQTWPLTTRGSGPSSAACEPGVRLLPRTRRCECARSLTGRQRPSEQRPPGPGPRLVLPCGLGKGRRLRVKRPASESWVKCSERGGNRATKTGVWKEAGGTRQRAWRPGLRHRIPF